jgi:hypothetical protein
MSIDAIFPWRQHVAAALDKIDRHGAHQPRYLIDRSEVPDLAAIVDHQHPGGWGGVYFRNDELHAAMRRSRCWAGPGFATVIDGAQFLLAGVQAGKSRAEILEDATLIGIHELAHHIVGSERDGSPDQPWYQHTAHFGRCAIHLMARGVWTGALAGMRPDIWRTAYYGLRSPLGTYAGLILAEAKRYQHTDIRRVMQTPAPEAFEALFMDDVAAYFESRRQAVAASIQPVPAPQPAAANWTTHYQALLPTPTPQRRHSGPVVAVRYDCGYTPGLLGYDPDRDPDSITRYA